MHYEVNMKLAIVGSRNLDKIEIEKYIPKDIDEIVSGGAKGTDSLAKEYAIEKGLKYTEFLPKYDLYGKAAPLKRNKEIADYADKAIAFWDGRSRGTKNVVELFKKRGKDVEIVLIK